MGSFKKNCERIGLTTEADELDWIIHQSNCAILFYDRDQVVGPSGINVERFEDKLKRDQLTRSTSYYRLLTQMCVKGGDGYIDYVRNILSGKATEKRRFSNYEFKVITDFEKFDRMHYEMEEQWSLTRMAAGYAWEWVSKNDKSKYDIEIVGSGRAHS